MAKHRIITLKDSSSSAVSPGVAHSGMDITIQNIDEEAVVYIGDANVTTSNYGFRLIPGAAWSVELPPKDNLYAISETNGSKIAVIRVNLEYQK